MSRQGEAWRRNSVETQNRLVYLGVPPRTEIVELHRRIVGPVAALDEMLNT